MSDGASNGFHAGGRAVGVVKHIGIRQGAEVDAREVLDLADRHLKGAERTEGWDEALGCVDELRLIEDEPCRGELAATSATMRRPSRTDEGPGCRDTAGRRVRGPAQ